MDTELAREPTQDGSRRDLVRGAVRGLLENTREFAHLPHDRRQALAHNLVQLTETQLDLMAEEQDADGGPASEEPMAVEQQTFNPQANARVGQQTAEIIDGIGFPRFVTELVNGVFKGLVDANAQQMQAYVDMISGVTAASADSAQSTGPGPARVWIVQNFPESYELGAATDVWGDNTDEGAAIVKLREGKDAPKTEDVAAMLELEGDAAQGLDPDEPEEGLLPKVRAYLSRKRQKVLASLLTLGMNRIVIDHGKIKAGMNFSIDAKSAAEENKARRFDFSNTTSGSGSFGAGPWGVSASMTNSIGIVRTKQTHEREDLTSNVNMNADVELHFRSDFVPLNALAAADSVKRIRAVSLNPQAPARTTPSGPTPAQKAATQVISTPTTKPAPKPTPQPAKKPPAKPAPKPAAKTAKPAPKPAATPQPASTKKK